MSWDHNLQRKETVHLRKSGSIACCGLSGYVVLFTEDTKKVTCKKCKEYHARKEIREQKEMKKHFHSRKGVKYKK